MHLAFLGFFFLGGVPALIDILIFSTYIDSTKYCMNSVILANKMYLVKLFIMHML